MLSGLAVVLIIIAAVFFLTLNLFRSLYKAVTITIFILFLLIILVGFLVIEDAREFGKIINNNKTTYLLDEGDDIITGFQAHRLNLSTFDDLDEDDIEEIREEPTGKIFIIKKGILSFNTTANQALLGFDIEDMLKSSSSENRARAFALTLAATIEEQGPFDMLLHIRDGNITVEPKTPVVYLTTATPRQLYKQGKEVVVKQVDKQVDLIREKVSS